MDNFSCCYPEVIILFGSNINFWFSHVSFYLQFFHWFPPPNLLVLLSEYIVQADEGIKKKMIWAKINKSEYCV